jgi:hypothetical protein
MGEEGIRSINFFDPEGMYTLDENKFTIANYVGKIMDVNLSELSKKVDITQLNAKSAEMKLNTSRTIPAFSLTHILLLTQLQRIQI